MAIHKNHGKGGTMEKSMTFNILAKKENNMWIAHCLELDIVATAKALNTLKKEIADLITTQIDYAFSNDNLGNLYHPAPAEIWKEFYDCKKSIEKRIKMKSGFKNNSFIPPWIIANTCFAQERVIA